MQSVEEGDVSTRIPPKNKRQFQHPEKRPFQPLLFFNKAGLHKCENLSESPR